MNRRQLPKRNLKWTIVFILGVAILAPMVNGYRKGRRDISLKLPLTNQHSLDDGVDILILPSATDPGSSRRQGVTIAGDGVELSDDQIEQQIDELVYINDRSWNEIGMVFLPSPPLVLGLPPDYFPISPGSANALLRPLVVAGTRAVPHLLAHLSDARRTDIMITETSIMNGGIYPAGAYDPGTFASPWSEERLAPKNARNGNHILTVGDLCFIALGQITNRAFFPAEHRHRGGVDISSPTSIPVLAQRARDEWSGLTPERHMQSLIHDSHNGRKGEAFLCLSYYYADRAEKIALEELAKPMFSWSVVQQFVEDSLYKTSDPKAWERLSNLFIAQGGPAYEEGLLRRLISDCNTLDGGERVETQDARLVFARIFPTIDRKTWSESPDVADDQSIDEIISNLTPLRSAKVDNEIYRHFQNVSGGPFDLERLDGFIFTCIARLIGKGHDQEFIDFCSKRALTNSDLKKEYGEMVNRLQASAKAEANQANH